MYLFLIALTIALSSIGSGASSPVWWTSDRRTLDLGVPAKAVPGRVTIELSSNAYRTTQPIRATVANGFRRPIYAEDLKSDCTVAILERWDGKNWHPLVGCESERIPRIVAIGPGLERVVMINPLSTHLQAFWRGTRGLRTGSYRIRFAYRLEPRGETDEFSVHSETFRLLP